MNMIPLAVPNLAGREAAYLQECVTSTFVSSAGPFVDRFEGMVAEAAGATCAVATSAGTTGLHAALLAAGVGRDDLVVVPSLTFIASANAIAHCGAIPWLFDVDPESWTLDAALLRRVFREEVDVTPHGARHRSTGRRVAAIMPVFTLGHPADMDAIVPVARKHGLPVVVDAAAALGARYKGRALARLGADLFVFSFNGNKTVTAGGGGAVVGDEALCRRVRHLTTTARVGGDYDHDEVGFNYRMTNLQAAVGCAQLENLRPFVEAKRRIRRRYDAAFSELSGLRAFPAAPWADSADWFSGFVLESGDPPALRRRLREAGVDCRPFWKPVHLQGPYFGAPRTAQHVGEAVWSRIVTLPCSTGLADADLAHVIAAVRAAVPTPP